MIRAHNVRTGVVASPRGKQRNLSVVNDIIDLEVSKGGGGIYLNGKRVSRLRFRGRIKVNPINSLR